MYYVSIWKIELKDGYICTDDHTFVERDVMFNIYENALLYVNYIENDLINRGFRLATDKYQSYPLFKEGRQYSSWFSDGKERYNITIVKKGDEG